MGSKLCWMLNILPLTVGNDIDDDDDDNDYDDDDDGSDDDTRFP